MKQINFNRLDSVLKLLEMVPVRTMEEMNLKITAMQTIATVITDEATPDANPDGGKDGQHENSDE